MVTGPRYMTVRLQLSRQEVQHLPTIDKLTAWCQRRGVVWGLVTEVRHWDDLAAEAWVYEFDLTTVAAALEDQQRVDALALYHDPVAKAVALVRRVERDVCGGSMTS